MKWGVAIIVTVIAAGGLAYGTLAARNGDENSPAINESTRNEDPSKNEGTKEAIPTAKLISGIAHVWQTFNNCSSVGLLMALSRWGISETQERIAEATRPWNNPRGDNDDKSVTLYELAEYARDRHDMLTYVRPNGDIELLKRFIANDIPVLARALMLPNDDIVHYRLVHGYDDQKKIVIESDGIEGANQTYTYDEWMKLWKDFNYSYVIVVPPEKKELVETLLGVNASEKAAWENAKKRAENELSKNPGDARAQYNVVTALYYLGDYAGSVREFEKIEKSLTKRKLWYQMEPIDAYFQLGKYDRVIELSDSVITNNNRAVSEL